MFLRDQMQEAAPELVFEERLPNPAAFADASAERSLKVLVYRAPEPAAKSATPPSL
jgi:23S rRNA (cytosine1962-C5)-methyltransferase